MQELQLNKKTQKPKSMRATRSHILNIIFQMEFLSGDTLFDRLENYYEILNNEENLTENEGCLIYYLNKELIFEYVNEICENIQSIDEKIKKYSIGWEMSRMSKLDLAILRLAIYEIIFRSDIPNKVAINEAVEFAKNLSVSLAYKFINGILREVLNEFQDKL